jgi:uncharacterized protein YcnI
VPDYLVMTATKMRRLTIGAGASIAGAAALVLAGAGVANAHVTVTPDEAEAGSYAVLTFSVPHGCDGSATTEVAIQIPEQTPSVTPTVNSNWDVEKVMVKRDEGPARVEQVVYTAKSPLPDGIRDTFELSMMPDSPGETLAFPVVQTCEEGETTWAELAEDLDDTHSLDAPAPLVTLTAPTAGDDRAADAAGETRDTPREAHDTGDATSTAITTDDAPSGQVLAIAGLAAGVLGVALGGTALARTRRKA